MLSVIRKCCVENSTGINIRVSFAIFQECISIDPFTNRRIYNSLYVDPLGVTLSLPESTDDESLFPLCGETDYVCKKNVTER